MPAICGDISVSFFTYSSIELRHTLTSVFGTAIAISMLSLALIICLASSLLFTTFAIPTAHISTTSALIDVNPSIFPPPNLTTVFLASNLTTTADWDARCLPNDPDPDPAKRANPITHPADCFQTVLRMLSQGSDLELLVWDSLMAWIHKSCGLFLIPSRRLPIHRDTFSRNDIAQSAESVRLACVNEENGYRGGDKAIAAGVFRVAVIGRPTPLSMGEWEESVLRLL